METYHPQSPTSTNIHMNARNAHTGWRLMQWQGMHTALLSYLPRLLNHMVAYLLMRSNPESQKEVMGFGRGRVGRGHYYDQVFPSVACCFPASAVSWSGEAGRDGVKPCEGKWAKDEHCAGRGGVNVKGWPTADYVAQIVPVEMCDLQETGGRVVHFQKKTNKQTYSERGSIFKPFAIYLNQSLSSSREWQWWCHSIPNGRFQLLVTSQWQQTNFQSMTA